MQESRSTACFATPVSCVRLSQAYVLLHVHLQIKSSSLFGATNFPGWAVGDSELSAAGVSHGVTIDELSIDVCARSGAWSWRS